MDEIADRMLVPTTILFREARVSREMGERVIATLKDAGEITTEKLPSRRELTTPKGAAAFFRALKR